MVKFFFRRIHLYLGLAAGLVIMTTCFTGAILAFEEELQHVFNKERYYVQPGTVKVPIDRMVKNLEELVPGAKVGSVKVFLNDAGRTVELTYKLKAKGKKDKAQKPKGGGQENNWKAFANPYTGAIIDRYEVRKSFFAQVLNVHRRLLADDTGKLIVGISTLIFLFIIITGIILWWPANKNILKQRLKIKTDASWKRTNHDWHIVLGFYCSIILFTFAFTGLAWSFKWFNNGIYYVTNSPLKNPEPPKSVVPADGKRIGFDNAVAAVAEHLGDAISFNINAPKEDSGVYSISLLKINASNETASDAYYVDAYSGKPAGQLLYADKSTGAKVRSLFKPIHTASIFGWPSKLLALLVTLVGTSLPVTGFIMWWNRKWRKARN